MKNAHQTSWDKGSWKDDSNSQHPPPPQKHTRNHFTLARTFTLTTYRPTHEADKNNSNMDSLINTTCFHKVTESANN